MNSPLNTKINQFLEWYQANMLSNHDKKFFTKMLRNFIDKMAFWYEILYPDNEINEIINQPNFDFCCNYDTYARFYQEMTSGYLEEPEFCNRIHLDYKCRRGYFYLDENYIVTKTEEMVKIPENLNYQFESFEGKSIFEIIEYFKEHNLFLQEVQRIEKDILKYKKSKYFKQELLNCIMYRIIEIHNCRIGPRRALLFAKEFDANKEIPMIYGVDSSDPHLSNFIKFYLQEGGRENITCIYNYHRLNKSHDKVTLIPMEKLLKMEEISKERDISNNKEIMMKYSKKTLKRIK